MTAHELELLWDRLDKLERKLDRMFWIVLLAAVAGGGPQVVSQLLSVGV